MKKYLLGTVALVALAIATPAAAADLGARYPVKAPPMVEPVWNWTGFYVGINGGYGWGDSKWGVLGSHDVDGGTVGGQIGYNWQIGPWVLGLEAQGNWADLSGSNANTLFGVTNHSKVDAFGLFTGKVGYAWNQFMLYAKGGAAVQSVEYSVSNTLNGVTLGSADETRWGASVGVGFEYAFAPNWSAGLEYNHLFMGKDDIAFSPANASDRIRLDTDVFTGRINYRFGGPVATRY
ncbi:outer membrane beta-barrel protein [Bradyrhizobium sp. LHD-71]|uniref:outer membrane protein n=1 Tax=Bradyrhizobium sp. LHD-71 TaxID=3072141 RepID=UPI00280D4D3C|nr:outer membrane beta-barrel protein [Bradyrhizobium sp. LHD-71]MDQ8728845.1 outer membrane beta-barrel protein [Bradyrhizobium sp. LHD-71]